MHTGVPTFIEKSGIGRLTLLKQNSRGITLEEMYDNGEMLQHPLISIPEHTVFDSAESTLLTSEFGDASKKAFGLVINETAQETYNIDGPTGHQLPILVTRQLDSIRSTIIKRPFQAIEDGEVKRRRTSHKPGTD